MNNKKKLIVIIIVFVLFMCGAAVLYNRLGGNVDRQQLVTQGDGADTSDGQGDGTESEVLENQDTEAIASDQATSEETASEDPGSEGTEAEKMLAPDFTVYDIDGNVVHLSDYVGKPVVLNFWASWCGPCKSEMPEFEEKYKELKDEVQFLMVNMTDGSRETVEVASEFINAQGYTFPVLYDTDINAAYLYSVYSLPTTYFIDKDGYIVAYAAGAIDGATLQKGIDMVVE